MDAAPRRSPRNPAAHRLADQLERAFRGGAWHGPSLAEALAGVDAATATRRPIADAHTIREVVGHVSTWMDLCRRRIEGEATGDVTAAEDWPQPGADGATSDEAWREELRLLEERHRRLRATVERLDDDGLDDPVAGSDPTVRGLLLGILQHHAYHGGQIVLLRKAGGAA